MLTYAVILIVLTLLPLILFLSFAPPLTISLSHPLSVYIQPTCSAPRQPGSSIDEEAALLSNTNMLAKDRLSELFVTSIT